MTSEMRIETRPMAAPVTYQVSKQAVLTGGLVTLHTVALSRWLTITCIQLTNTDASARQASVTLGLGGQGKAILWNFSIPGDDFIEFGAGIKAPPGTVIQGSASVGGVMNLLVCGVEETLTTAP